MSAPLSKVMSRAIALTRTVARVPKTQSFMLNLPVAVPRHAIQAQNIHLPSRAAMVHALSDNIAWNCQQCSRAVHTPASSSHGDKELTEFLEEEIKHETDQMKGDTPKIGDFTIKANGSEVTLSKDHAEEKIRVLFNVNHSVDADMDNIDETAQSGESPPPVVSRPPFTVEVVKADQVLCFNCTLMGEDPEPIEDPSKQEEYPEDKFSIDDVQMYEKEFARTTYSLNGEVMDGEMYDRLMDYLADRGIDGDFAEKLVRFSTQYEASQYVDLLKKMKNFLSC